MSQRLLLCLYCLLLALPALAQRDRYDDYSHSDASFVCESIDNRYAECRKPWSGPAQLEQKLSQAGCAHGHGWGQNDRVVWVDRGCRGVFAMESGPPRQRDREYGLPPSQPDYQRDRGYDRDRRRDDYGEIVCESHDHRYQRCDWSRRWGEPVLVEQLSRTRCEEGRTWGYSRRERAVWVDGGCRARFQSR